MLAEMGFTHAQARKALRETVRRCGPFPPTVEFTDSRTHRHTQNGDAERAVEWLFSHPDDTGEDNAPPAATATAVPQQQQVPARYRLRAFVSHKGPSVHSGHYVAHIRTDDGWVLFNDEKVVKADAESVRALRALAYLYVFEREPQVVA